MPLIFSSGTNFIELIKSHFINFTRDISTVPNPSGSTGIKSPHEFRQTKSTNIGLGLSLPATFKVSAVCTVAGGAHDGAEVLPAACGLRGSCAATCCCNGGDTGMKPAADGTRGMLESAGLGIMTPGSCIIAAGGTAVRIG
jgi:hypothetical protein